METTTILLILLLVIAVVGIFAYIVNGALAQLNNTVTMLAQRLNEPVVTAGNEASEEKSQKEALRLQACERLTLMLERINVPNLLLRLPPAPAASAKEYTASLLLNIRQEFEYNVTQQIYVSDALWSIMLQARDNVSQLIVRAAEGAETGEQVVSRLRLMSSRQPDDAIAVGQAAIRREASLLL